jgi:oxygen-independent coproporphyrinogen-3 oxidase
MWAAMQKEISLRADYLNNQPISTLYFGGGTPSLMSLTELSNFVSLVHQTFDLSQLKEQTIEVNPDDLTAAYLEGLLALGFNRLSIGTQSFIDSELLVMNRRHTADAAFDAVRLAQSVGFSNISLDIIYGLPNSTVDSLQVTLDRTLSLGTPHLSCYHLTYESKTAFSKMRDSGKIAELTEDNSLSQYGLICKTLADCGFEHYEVSNFAKSGLYSAHNLSYWNQTSYLGIGPSAHSYNGSARHINIAHNRQYLEAVSVKMDFIETEVLTAENIFDEFLLLSLRRNTGISLAELNLFDAAFVSHFWNEFSKLPVADFHITSTSIALTEPSFFKMDFYLTKLFV